MLSQIRQNKYYIYHLYNESKIVKFIEAESIMMIAKGWEAEKQEGISQRIQSFSYTRWITPENLHYRLATIVKNAVLYTYIKANR